MLQDGATREEAMGCNRNLKKTAGFAAGSHAWRAWCRFTGLLGRETVRGSMSPGFAAVSVVGFSVSDAAGESPAANAGPFVS